MLVLPQKIEVGLTSKYIQYYEDKGYFIERKLNNKKKMVVTKGTKLEINVLDLPTNSDAKVLVKCDYCGQIMQKQYKAYNIQRNKKIKKDACKKCAPQKAKEGNLLVYGLESPSQLKDTKQKLRNERKLSDEFIRYQFALNGYIVVNMDYQNNHSPIDFICSKHIEKGVQRNIYSRLQYYGNICKYCGLEKRSGENHYEWAGGITPLHEHLRHVIQPWKTDSFKRYNFKCFITDAKEDLIIHHLYPFVFLMREALRESKLPLYEQVSQYTNSEMSELEQKCLELHYKYGLGVCLTKEVHNLFHNIYGKRNNTPEQFWKFEKRWKNEEFIKLEKKVG